MVLKLHEIVQWACRNELRTQAALRHWRVDRERGRGTGRTPWSVEFMKQVFPWLMSPGGRLASFSSSSRRFFSQYSSCGVCLLLCLIIDGGCLDVRNHRK